MRGAGGGTGVVDPAGTKGPGGAEAGGLGRIPGYAVASWRRVRASAPKNRSQSRVKGLAT